MIKSKGIVSGSNKAEDTFHLTWSDLTALLLALFAYIISISTIDQVKLTKATQSMNRGLVGQQEDYVSMNDFVEFTAAIELVVKESNLQSDVSIQNKPNGMVINLGHKMLFESGAAVLKPEAKKVLNVVANELKTRSVKVLVEGHTDNVPINTEQFPSNWHLSSIRASEVVKYFSAQGVDPSNLTLVGYADVKPMIANTSEENRQKNRRVIILVEPKRHVSRDIPIIEKKGIKS
jgi:chemotaxis protein MotB